jgi:hypothetical protein
MFRPREDGGDFGLLLPNDAFCDHRLERAVFSVNARWQPKRDPKAVVGALRCPSFKRIFSKGSEKSRYVQQILMRIIIHPARYRISDKGQDQRGDGMVDLGITGNGRDFRWLHSHGDVPAW